MGDPDLGSGNMQPGGWIFGLLPYIEQGNLLTIGKGMPLAQKKIELGKQMATVIPMFNCPSRRAPVGYPGLTPAGTSPDNPIANVDAAAVPQLVAKTDYAMNGGNGNLGIARGDSAPPGCDDVKNLTLWSATGTCGTWARNADNALVNLQGLVAIRSKVSLRQVSDGTSNTILVGEKFLRPINYDSGVGIDGKNDPGDNSAMYQGYDWDNTRFTGANKLPREDADPTAGNTQEQECFGSAHASGINLVNVDGSVQSVSYDVDPQVWSEMGHRANGG
jgi:hypothetical protein